MAFVESKVSTCQIVSLTGEEITAFDMDFGDAYHKEIFIFPEDGAVVSAGEIEYSMDGVNYHAVTGGLANVTIRGDGILTLNTAPICVVDDSLVRYLRIKITGEAGKILTIYPRILPRH
jgi:hypothetical protein